MLMVPVAQVQVSWSIHCRTVAWHSHTSRYSILGHSDHTRMSDQWNVRLNSSHQSACVPVRLQLSSEKMNIFKVDSHGWHPWVRLKCQCGQAGLATEQVGDGHFQRRVGGRYWSRTANSKKVTLDWRIVPWLPNWALKLLVIVKTTTVWRFLLC